MSFIINWMPLSTCSRTLWTSVGNSALNSSPPIDVIDANSLWMRNNGCRLVVLFRNICDTGPDEAKCLMASSL